MRAPPALAAAASTGILVGVALVLTRAVVAEAGPITVAWFRYLVGLLVLLPWLLSAPLVRFRRRDLLPIVLLGIGQFGVLIALLNFAVTVIDAGQAALIFAVFPLLTMALAILLRQEPFTPRRAAGILLTIVGVGLSIGESALAGDFTGRQWLGAGAAFLSAFCGALCSVLYRPYVQRYPALQISCLAMVAAIVFLTVLALPEGIFEGWPAFSAGGWLAILGIGLASGAGYLAWLYALRLVWASNVTAFMGLSPVTAALLGALFLGETLTWGDAAGVGLVLAGLALALWRSGAPAGA